MRPAKHVQLRVHLAFQTLDDSYPDVAPHLLCVEQIILNLTPGFRIHIERVILHAQPKLLESSKQDQGGNVSIPVVCAISGILGGLTACMFLFLELKFSLGLQRQSERNTDCSGMPSFKLYTQNMIVYSYMLWLSRQCKTGRRENYV